MKNLILIVVACSMSVTGLTQTRPSSSRNELVGVWKLVRIEVRHPNGIVTADPDFGPHAIGYISYDQTGHVSVHIMNPDFPRWKDEDHPSAAEAISTLEHGYSAYAGTYELHEREGYVVHHPELALIPNYIGQVWKRQFKIDGNLLRLTPPPFKSVDGELLDETLIWERMR
jgi:hypothetical protein